MKQSHLFNILNSVDSTNNYAMAKVHAGLATHGMAWFAQSQTGGKGQRGKAWQSEPGKNIILSMVLKTAPIFKSKPFCFSALIALCCSEFIHKITDQKVFIKWPNDLYWRDRKAGGILIENVFAGTEWKWAVVGIGINVNQTNFDGLAREAVSLKEMATKSLNPVLLARGLHQCILDKLDALRENEVYELLPLYNALLYKKNEMVKLRKDAAVFSTTIKGVNENGQLMTADVLEREFDFGTVEWVL
ncbi:MAG: biotin--[acetyl-CoA-carboxylase] ligase [Gloeobacteraceae cyanobacterium ES-bin-316]|nr:biotin--[acetyl-CoA-carboxylase] ligase [Ferruginibacter sp.]